MEHKLKYKIIISKYIRGKGTGSRAEEGLLNLKSQMGTHEGRYRGATLCINFFIQGKFGKKSSSISKRQRKHRESGCE